MPQQSRRKLRTTRKRSTRRMTRRKTIRRRGGAKIGQGTYGAVHMPPLKCLVSANDNGKNEHAEANKKYATGNYVSKLTSYYSAKKELFVSSQIRERVKNWNKFCCLVDYICQYDPEQISNMNRNNNNKGNNKGSNSSHHSVDERNYIAISQYCGIPISKVLDSIIENKVGDLLTPPQKNISSAKRAGIIVRFLSALGQFIVYMGDLHKGHIYHQDIHRDNILYDIGSGQLRLIDFGLSEVHENVAESPTHKNSQLMDLEMLLNTLYEVVCVIVKSRILDTEEDGEYHSNLKQWLTLGISDEIVEIVELDNENSNAHTEYNSNGNYNNYKEHIENICMDLRFKIRINYTRKRVKDIDYDYLINLIQTDIGDLKDIIDAYTP